MDTSSVRGHRHCESKFKRHIESGCTRRAVIKCHPREVMKRIGTLPNHLDYPIQPPLTSRNFNRRSRSETKTAQARDQSEEKRLILFVVRNIQKRALG